MNLVGGLKINQLFDEPPFTFVIEFAAAPGNVYGVADSRTAADVPGRGLPNVDYFCYVIPLPVLPLDGERRHFAVLAYTQKPPDPHYSITRNTNTITYSRAQFRLYTAVSYLAPLLLYCVLFAKANNIEVAPVTGLGSSAQG